MTIQECYAALEGDYQEVLGRLCSDALVRRFVGKFLSDPSFPLLERSMREQSYEEAFRAAHTLKGVTQNLSFTRLYRSSHELTEALRAQDHALAVRLFSQVEEDYLQTTAAIRAFQND